MKKVMFLILCLILMVQFVSAETINGTFDYTAVTSVATTSGISQATPTSSYHTLLVPAIELTAGSFAYVSYDGNIPSYNVNLPKTGGSINCNIRDTNINGAILGTGTFGYMRNYNLLGQEIAGYQYVLFNDDYTIGIIGLSGAKRLYLDWDEATLGGGIAINQAGAATIATGGMAWAGREDLVSYHTLQNGVLNKNYIFHNTYSATSPSGLGITGSVVKQVNGIIYPSKAYIYDGSTLAQLASDNTLTGNTFTFNTAASKIIIGAKNSNSVQINSSTLFTPNVNFTLFVTETNLVSGQSTTGALSSPSNDLANIKAINYYKTQVGDSEPTYESTSFYESGSTEKTLNYVFRSPNWYGYNTADGDYTNNKGTTRPEPVSLNFPYGGSYDVGAFVFTGVNLDLTDTPKTRVAVDSSAVTAKSNLLLYASDATTSQFISPVNYAVKNLVNNSWQNYTSNQPDGSANFAYNNGVGLAVYISATGYQSTSFTTTLNGNKIITTPLTPINLVIPATNLNWTNLQVTLKFTNDGVTYNPLSGAAVSVESFDPADSIAKQYGNTNSEGIVFFTALNQSHNHAQTYSYVITSVIPNYKTVSKSIIPTGNLYTVQLWTQVNQIINPTGQPTIIPITAIPTATPARILTPSAWGGVGGNGSICVPVTGNTTLLESFKINLACNGVTGGQAQSLTLAGLICLVFMLAGSRYGKGMGAAFGGIIGFVLSLAMGFIPFWVFAALIVLCGLAAAIIVTRSST